MNPETVTNNSGGSKITSSAILSDDGMYRYQLGRVWDETKPILGWIMLNPSTADQWVNDPTVRECMGWARRLKYGGIVIANLFAFRATKPADMMCAEDPIGPDNDAHITHLVANCSVIAFAWGAKGGYRGRFKEVISIFDESRAQIKCLGSLLPNGHPRHPLGTAGPTTLQPLDLKKLLTAEVQMKK